MVRTFRHVAVAGLVAAAGLPAGADARSIHKLHYLAGYMKAEAAVAPAFNVSTQFKVPRLRCGSGLTAFVPSVGVYSGQSKETYMGLFAGCDPVQYWASSVINGRNLRHGPSGIVRPGDVVRLSVYESARRSYISLIDKTRRIGWRRSGAGAGHLNSPFIGDSSWASPSGADALAPPFGSLRFTQSTINRRPLGSVTRLSRNNMTTDSGRVEIVTGPLARGQRAFTTSYKR